MTTKALLRSTISIVIVLFLGTLLIVCITTEKDDQVSDSNTGTSHSVFNRLKRASFRGRKNKQCDPVTRFRCVSNGKCLPLSAKCDGKVNCVDASDEAYCIPPDTSTTTEFSRGRLFISESPTEAPSSISTEAPATTLGNSDAERTTEDPYWMSTNSQTTTLRNSDAERTTEDPYWMSTNSQTTTLRSSDAERTTEDFSLEHTDPPTTSFRSVDWSWYDERDYFRDRGYRWK